MMGLSDKHSWPVLSNDLRICALLPFGRNRSKAWRRNASREVKPVKSGEKFSCLHGNVCPTNWNKVQHGSHSGLGRDESTLTVHLRMIAKDRECLHRMDLMSRVGNDVQSKRQ